MAGPGHTSGYVLHSWYAKRMNLVPDDTREQLEHEADYLYAAMHILRYRFATGKHNDTAAAVRQAAQELISRSRHPSRMRTRDFLAVEAGEAETVAAMTEEEFEQGPPAELWLKDD